MSGEWEPVAGGKSGATVLRRGEVYRKVGPDAELEATKLRWLRDQGVAVPEVLTVEAGAFEMRAARGRPADSTWSAADAPWVLDAIATTVRSLHRLDPADCPFDRTLAVVVDEARRAVEAGTVDLDDLDARRRGWTATDLWAALEAVLALPSPEELRVTHGDLSLNNLIVDPDSHSVTLVDVARAGVADLHGDLAILTRSLRDHWAPGGAGEAEARLVMQYGRALDPRRVELYRLIDEFF